MKISELKQKKGNPRKITPAALAKLAESIERDPEFMVLRPMVIDEDGSVLGGNQRLKAIQKLGMDEIPDTWVVKAADLTDEQKRRFILVDNAPAGMAGEWDVDLLSDQWEISELVGMGFDVELFGPDENKPGEGVQPEGKDKTEQKIIQCPGCGAEVLV